MSDRHPRIIDARTWSGRNGPSTGGRRGGRRDEKERESIPRWITVQMLPRITPRGVCCKSICRY